MPKSRRLPSPTSALAALVLLGAAGPASPCDAGSCPLLTQSQDSVRTKGSFGLDVSYRSMSYDRHLGRPGAGSPLVDFENGRLIGNHHRDASMDHGLLQLDLSYGLTPRLTLLGALPLMNRRSHGHYDYQPVEGDGQAGHEHGPIPAQWVLGSDEVAHRENGIGDVQLGATWAALWSARESLVLRAVVELPTGEYRSRDNWGYIDRPEVQPGSGSTDFVGALQYQRGIGGSGFGLLASGMYRANGENPLGYRFGEDASFGFGLTRSSTSRFRWSAQFAWRFIGKDSFNGQSVPATGIRPRRAWRASCPTPICRPAPGWTRLSTGATPRRSTPSSPS
jgi:hypothetical protein